MAPVANAEPMNIGHRVIDSQSNGHLLTLSKLLRMLFRAPTSLEWKKEKSVGYDALPSFFSLLRYLRMIRQYVSQSPLGQSNSKLYVGVRRDSSTMCSISTEVTVDLSDCFPAGLTGNELF